MVSRSIFLKNHFFLFFKTLLRNLEMDNLNLSIFEFRKKVLKKRFLYKGIISENAYAVLVVLNYIFPKNEISKFWKKTV